jgi:hypothetical protein
MTPFELRAEMLKMAQDYLKTQYETNLEFTKTAFEQMLKAGQVTQEQFKDYVPKMYSFDEITSKAQELYSFVKEK